MIDYSIVIPCFRSGEQLALLVRRIVMVMEDVGKPYEVILIDDDSPDDTWETISQIVASQPHVRGLRLMFNTGQFRATICGLEHAEGYLIITMDDDLQHAPEDIPLLLDRIERDPALDCVIAAFKKKRHSWFRNIGSQCWRFVNSLLYRQPRQLRPGSFRVLRCDVAKAVCRHGTSYPVLGPLLYETTRRIANVLVDHHPRVNGESGYRWHTLFKIFTANYLNSTTFPLRVISLMGFATAVGSVVLGIYYFYGFATKSITVPGFVTTVLLILFFGGLTLFSVGLLGEYVKRIIEEVRRPLRYAVRAEIRQTSEQVEDERPADTLP